MRLSQWLVVVGVALVVVCGVVQADKVATDEPDVVEEDFDAEDVEDVAEDDETPVKTTDEDQAKLNERPDYKQPRAKGQTYFTETFHTPMNYEKRWVKSQAKKEDTDDAIAKYDGEWKLEEPKENPMKGEDLGLVLKSKAKHHAISAKLDKTYEFTGKPFILQYEVKFQDGQECGGAYIKLLTQDKSLDLKNFKDKTSYTIMFGPDKCGNDNKLHFIFRHRNPITGKYEEKHAKKPTSGIDTFFTDKRTHLFTLVINPDNTWEVLVDQDLVNSGSLLEDMEPAVNPAKEIIDPDDKKPVDWDEREKIPDPDATKPEDWDESQPEKIPDADAVKPEGWLDEEPELIPDPDAERPADWDEDMDGAWEAPLINNPKCESAPGCGEWKRPEIKNPKYKGKWKAPLIENPNYKGKWVPRKIANPDYFEDKEPYKMTSISAIGLELWSMSSDLLFDNFIITDDKQVADKWAADSWELKYKQELSGGNSGRSVVQAVLDVTKDRPWLWAVFIIVIVLPIVLIIAYCCMPSKAEDVAQYKKTDEPQPDSKEETKEPTKSENKEEDDVDEGDDDKKDSGSGDKQKTSPKKSAEAKKPSKSDLDAEENNEADEDEEAEDAGEQATKSSPRKRKTRARKD